MAVHLELRHEAVNPQECLGRYSQLTRNCEPLYAVAVKQTALIEDDEEPEPSVMNQSQRWAAVRKVSKIVESRLAELGPLRFGRELERYRQQHGDQGAQAHKTDSGDLIQLNVMGNPQWCI